MLLLGSVVTTFSCYLIDFHRQMTSYYLLKQAVSRLQVQHMIR